MAGQTTPQETAANKIYSTTIECMRPLMRKAKNTIPYDDGTDRWMVKTRSTLRAIEIMGLRAKISMRELGVPADDPDYKSITDIVDQSMRTLAGVGIDMLPPEALQWTAKSLYEKYFM